MSRQTDRKQLRPVGEFISAKVIPGLPRRLRRLMGRAYGNAAYRKMHELDHDLYTSSDHGYSNYKLHPTLTNWVAEQGEKLLNPIEPPPPATEVHDGDASAEAGKV